MGHASEHALEAQLKQAHKATGDLNVPLKVRLVALILYANTFDRVDHGDFRKLVLACINLACKMEENYYRLEKIIEYFVSSFDNFEVKREEIARIEYGVAKALEFEFEVVPTTFVYLRLLKTLNIQKPNFSKIKMIESVHLDSRILKLRYFKYGDTNPCDLALSLIEHRDLKQLCKSFNFFADFYTLQSIRYSFGIDHVSEHIGRFQRTNTSNRTKGFF